MFHVKHTTTARAVDQQCGDGARREPAHWRRALAANKVRRGAATAGSV